MAQTIKLRRSAIAGRIPNPASLELGEVAINTTDGKMYIKKAVNGDESIVEIGANNFAGTSFTQYTYTATANQTVFTGNDNSGSALDIVDEFSNVFMNGILLDPEIDFTVSSDGLTLTLTEPAEADDILQINSFDQAIFNGTLNVDALALTGMTGQMAWNSDEETINVPLNDDVTLQLGQEFVFRGKATEAISNGDVVMFAGAQGGHLLIAKANMSAVGFLPEHVIGIATQDLNVNDFGFVTELGKVRDLDTSGYSEGDILYLDPTTAGALTTTKPTPPNHAIQMCAVVRSHGTQGTLLVRPTHMADTDEIAEGSSNLYFTVARAVAAIKADGDWNASDWDTAFGWGDHASEGYLTSVAFNDLTSTPTTISGYGITDAFDGAYSSLTGKPTLFSGSYTDLTNKPTIPTVPTTVSSFTNDSGYITDYTVTQGDVTAHQAALSITESQISDLGSYLTSETNTTLQIVGNTLRYTDETGTNTDIDLSLYLDDTNLSRLISGSLDANGTATFTRDDDSTFTVDFSQFFDDTNLARITSAAFNTADGVLTLTRDDATTITADLDGRYLTSHQDISGKADLSGDTFTGLVTLDTANGYNNDSGSTQLRIDAGDGYSTLSFYDGGNASWDLYRGGASSWVGDGSIGFLHHSGALNANRVKFKIDTSGNITALGTITASGYNKTNWDAAYGWGDHSTQGYLTDTRAGFQVTSTQYAPAAVAYIPGNKAYFDVLVEFSNGVFFDIKASTSEGVISTRHNYVESGANPEIDAIFTTYNETEDRTYLGIYYATTGTYDITFTQNSINTDLVLFSAYTSGFEGSTYGTNAAYPSNNFFKGLADKAADAELLDGYNSSDFALVDNVYDKTAVNSISDWDNMPLGFGSNAQTDRTNQPKANVSITLTLENENSAGRKAQLFFGDTPDSLYFRPRQGDTVGWHSWEKLWTTASFSSTDVSNWGTAYGWGNHASAGYLTSHQDISGKADLSGATFTGDVIVDGGVGVNSSGTFHVRQKGDTVNDGITITSSHGTAHRIWKDSSGVLNFGVSNNGDQFGIDTSGNLKVNGTTVIDSSRNLTNINRLDMSDSAIRSDSEFAFLTLGNGAQTAQMGGLGIGSSYSAYPVFTGGVNTQNGYQVGATTVIDSSRNLTNVPSLTNTSDIAIRPAAGTDILLFNNHNSESQLRLYNNRQDLSYVPVSSVVGYNAEQVAKMVFYRGGNSASGFIRFQDKPSNTSDLRDVFQIGNGIAGSYGVDVLDGSYRVAGTTVIDSDRNLTNIQTLSLCEGTSEKAKLDITSSDNFMLTATGGGGAGLLLWGAGSTVPTISPLKEGVGVNGEVNLGRSNERFNDAWFAGDVIAGNVGIGTSTLYQRLTVSGIIEAGDAATVGGGVGLTLPYNGSTNDYTVNYGGMYSSGGVLIGYGVRSSTDTPNTYTSTYDNFSGVKAALRMDDALRFLASASAVHTRGDAVAMSERFTVKSNGNVGLGITNPSNRFEIQSAYNNAIVLHDNRTATSGTYRHGIKFNHYNSYANGIYFEHNDYFGIARDACVIEVGNSEKFRISYQGKVGIGLGGSTPAAKLTIQGSSGYTVANSGKAIEGIDVNATAGGTNLGGGAISFGVGGAGRASIAAIQGTGDGDNTELAFNVHGSTSAHDAIEVVRVSSDSRVGINTQAPEQALHVAGAVKVNSASHSNTINGGLVIDGPAYKEYQFNWNGLTNHTITMTTGSYFMAEVVYTAHQTNSGTDYNEYRRGKWANNYTTHIWEEFENSGNIGAMDTSFTVSENTVSNSGKLVIQENYIAASYSRSTLTVRVYYGSFAITKS